MTRTVRLTSSEARKLLLSRTFLGAVAISVGLALFTVLVDAAVAGQKGQPRLGTPADVHQLLKLGPVATVAMLVVGILSSGGEFRHHTIISTLLTTPRRGAVVAAKATTVLLAGVALTTATFAVGIGTIYVVWRPKMPATCPVTPPASCSAP
jgi:ABC-2 type transport system permease protein